MFGNTSRRAPIVLLALLGGVICQAIPARSLSLFPEGVQYEPYLASPTEPRFKLGRITVNDPEIPKTGETRWELKAGRNISFLRLGRDSQINLLGGFMASFDTEESTDSIAWDGLFGAQYVLNLSPRDRLKVEYFHQSAHRGDEFLLRTGRDRIDYTRQELNLGFSRHWFPRLRTYAEAGWGFTLRNPNLQEAGRLQTGLEYGVPGEVVHAGDSSGWFLAADFESYEELDWQVDSTVSIGVFGLRNGELWRLGLELRDGRTPYGEFFRSDETYVGLSVWNDSL